MSHLKFFIIALFFLFGSPLQSTWAQGKKQKKDPTSSYTGNEVERTQKYQGTGKDITVKVKKPKSNRDKRDDASMRSSFTGNHKFVNLRKVRAKSNAKLSDYSGKVSVRKLKNTRRNNRDQGKEIAAFSGNVRYVNVQKNRSKTSRKLSSFRGPVAIRIPKKPKGSQFSKYRGAPNRPRSLGKYNKSSLRKGRRIKKSELPNYAKVKKRKMRYDPVETKMWQRGGDNLPKARERKLPKVKKRDRKAAEEQSTKAETEE